MILVYSLLRCLAHFPPADTYESRANAADVSCVYFVTLSHNFLIYPYWRSTDVSFIFVDR